MLYTLLIALLIPTIICAGKAKKTSKKKKKATPVVKQPDPPRKQPMIFDVSAKKYIDPSDKKDLKELKDTNATNKFTATDDGKGNITIRFNGDNFVPSLAYLYYKKSNKHHKNKHNFRLRFLDCFLTKLDFHERAFMFTAYITKDTTKMIRFIRDDALRIAGDNLTIRPENVKQAFSSDNFNYLDALYDVYKMSEFTLKTQIMIPKKCDLMVIYIKLFTKVSNTQYSPITVMLKKIVRTNKGWIKEEWKSSDESEFDYVDEMDEEDTTEDGDEMAHVEPEIVDSEEEQEEDTEIRKEEGRTSTRRYQLYWQQ
ncbi:hypothetical protein ECANGB1_1459 [Enterospora canceri]|uniref:Uncharacterized protein n=1 Tax=Enterospora canceri TaxID=1081671 RepID=A0A1Y1S611_9MICR|nr:hypothetical protein ECANGB1_1459 [Enterospora canceri]